jgi:hypothetical protein
MANDKIKLLAEANKLKIPNYRKMSEADLRTAIATAQGTGSTPAKGKGKPAASSNGSAPAKGKGKPATPAKGKVSATPAKGKGKTASAPAKYTAQKSTPAKGKAAQGTAKRPSTPAKGKAATSGKGKTTPATPKASAAKPSTRGKAKVAEGRADIDRKTINWKAESNVGKTGKRAEVMAALRKRNGNYDKVFDDLKDKAIKWYPNALNSYPQSPNAKHAAQRMLRWLIGRVAYDFAFKSGQHTSAKRAGYGQSDKTQDVRRREQREAARAQRDKDARKAKRNAGKASTTAKGKPAARKPAAKGKGK